MRSIINVEILEQTKIGAAQTSHSALNTMGFSIPTEYYPKQTGKLKQNSYFARSLSHIHTRTHTSSVLPHSSHFECM